MMRVKPHDKLAHKKPGFDAVLLKKSYERFDMKHPYDRYGYSGVCIVQ